jgi:hypothetical protein
MVPRQTGAASVDGLELSPNVIEDDLTWTGHRFEPGLRVVAGDDGRIEAVTRRPDGDRPSPAREPEVTALSD